TGLCERGLLIQHGRVVKDGSAADVVHEHVAGGGESTSVREFSNIDEAPGDESVRLRAMKIIDRSGAPAIGIDASQEFGIQMTFDVLEDGQVLNPYMTLSSDAGVDLFSTANTDQEAEVVPRKKGRYMTTAWVPGHLLAPGTHYVKAVMRSIQRQYRPFTERDVVAFSIAEPESERFGTGWWEGKPSGLVRPSLDWSTEYVEEAMKDLS
ncbi:MAG: Wzt carbohydrate-binding domain-containing protein, partial [Gammaproteobacteria bacterium]